MEDFSAQVQRFVLDFLRCGIGPGGVGCRCAGCAFRGRRRGREVVTSGGADRRLWDWHVSGSQIENHTQD